MSDDVLGQIQYGVTTSGPVGVWTMGLCKYGQPELAHSLPDRALQPAACSLMGAVAQALVRAAQPVNGALSLATAGWGEVRLRPLRGRRASHPRYEFTLAGDDGSGAHTFAALAAAAPVDGPDATR